IPLPVDTTELLIIFPTAAAEQLMLRADLTAPMIMPATMIMYLSAFLRYSTIFPSMILLFRCGCIHTAWRAQRHGFELWTSGMTAVILLNLLFMTATES